MDYTERWRAIPKFNPNTSNVFLTNNQPYKNWSMQSDTGQHSPRSSTLFTFGYPNLMLSLLQYISFYFNIKIATFVGFQIAVYTYVVLRTFTYLHTLCCVLLLDNTLYWAAYTWPSKSIPFWKYASVEHGQKFATSSPRFDLRLKAWVLIWRQSGLHELIINN